MLKIFLYLLFFFVAGLYGQDTVRILFVYGSRPADNGEPKWFGGIHGGHVSVQYLDKFASFVPNGRFHVFSSKQNFHSEFVTETKDMFVFDTTGSRYLIMGIIVDSIQKRALDSVINNRLQQSPYDYALFGMRCASAAYELFSSAGIFPQMKRTSMVRRFFYPRKLRKKLLKEAKIRQWQLYYREGKKSRKWERD